jgi:hypothetical protein
VLFARYAAGLQDWTVVGSIGHYGQIVTDGVMDNSGLARADDSVDRSGSVRFINHFISYLGTLGFVDLPADGS